LFNESASEKKNMVKLGVFGAGSMGLVMAVTMFLPEFGPSFHYSWLASLLTGCALWLIVFTLKKFEVGFR
jgi:hypothetical protein